MSYVRRDFFLKEERNFFPFDLREKNAFYHSLYSLSADK